jgi:hypothetical protein
MRGCVYEPVQTGAYCVLYNVLRLVVVDLVLFSRTLKLPPPHGTL